MGGTNEVGVGGIGFVKGGAPLLATVRNVCLSHPLVAGIQAVDDDSTTETAMSPVGTGASPLTVSTTSRIASTTISG